MPSGAPGFVQGLITTTYLSAAEYDLLASLPAAVMSKTRLSIPPLSVDVFDPPRHGLVMADAEFGTDEAARSFRPPAGVVAEVTDDPRFTGGRLVRPAGPTCWPGWPSTASSPSRARDDCAGRAAAQDPLSRRSPAMRSPTMRRAS